MRSFFGATLLGCGILIAGLSGLCTLALMFSILVDSSAASREELMYLPAALIFAGIPFVMGIGLYFIGRHLIRTADREDVLSAPPPAPPGNGNPEG
jgi:hypothetical protein